MHIELSKYTAKHNFVNQYMINATTKAKERGVTMYTILADSMG